MLINNIGKWTAKIDYSGKTPQLIVSGTFSTNILEPFQLVKKEEQSSDDRTNEKDKVFNIILLYGHSADNNGDKSCYVTNSFAISGWEYNTVSIKAEKGGKEIILADIEITDPYEKNDSYFKAYLEIIKAIEFNKEFLKIRVPSNGLTTEASFHINIIKGITGEPPYWLEIYRIKPDYGKMFLPEGVELLFPLNTLEVEYRSTYNLINKIGNS